MDRFSGEMERERGSRSGEGMGAALVLPDALGWRLWDHEVQNCL
jgi:hypothetical protein